MASASASPLALMTSASARPRSRGRVGFGRATDASRLGLGLCLRSQRRRTSLGFEGDTLLFGGGLSLDTLSIGFGSFHHRGFELHLASMPFGLLHLHLRGLVDLLRASGFGDDLLLDDLRLQVAGLVGDDLLLLHLGVVGGALEGQVALRLRLLGL